MDHPQEDERSTIDSSETALDGTWERQSKSPLSAAVIGLTMIGVIYFYAQAVMTAIGTVIAAGNSSVDTSGMSFIDRLSMMVSVSKQPLRISLFISQFLCMLLPTLWLTKRWHSRNIRHYLRITSVPIAEIVLAVVITLLFLPAGHFITNFITTQLNIPDFFIEVNEQIYTAYSIPEFLWLTVVVCITPAVCEEIFFRGYVQRTMERSVGTKSVYIIGIVFGLFHLQPINLVTLSLLGILFGFFFYRSRSIVPGIAAHFTNNFLVIVFMSRSSDGTPLFRPFLSQIGLLEVMMTIPPLILLLRYYHFRTQRLQVQ